jgi:hypothetical protein
VFCNSGDGVCTGAFAISVAHLSYTTNGDIGKAVSFVQRLIKENKSGGGECKYSSFTGRPKGAPKGAPKPAAEEK